MRIEQLPDDGRAPRVFYARTNQLTRWLELIRDTPTPETYQGYDVIYVGVTWQRWVSARNISRI
jgi:hypothetical protein